MNLCLLRYHLLKQTDRRDQQCRARNDNAEQNHALGCTLDNARCYPTKISCALCTVQITIYEEKCSTDTNFKMQHSALPCMKSSVIVAVQVCCSQWLQLHLLNKSSAPLSGTTGFIFSSLPLSRS